MAHHLLAVTPLSGHLAPLVRIGEALRSAGHTVTVLTSAGHAAAVERAGLRFAALPGDSGIDPPAASPRWARPLPAQVRRFLLGRAELDTVFVEPLGRQAAGLRTLLRREPIDAVLVDLTFTGAVPLLLDTGPRPPVVVCGVGPLTLSSVDTPPFGMAWQPRPGVDYRTMTSVAHRVIMGASQRRFDQALHDAGVGPAPVFVGEWPRLADGLLQLSLPGFEYPRSDLPAGVEFVGPVLPGDDAGFDPPIWWKNILDAATVVHVTQGTFDNHDLNQLMAPTLAALAGREDVLVVATTGGRSGQQLSGPLPGNARVTDWLPYASLMPHVDVMITNGGFGGVQCALSHGVPLVVAGETSDKAEVAARVEYTGAGINLGTAAPTPAAIAAAVDRVMAGTGYRAAAARLRREIAASAPLDAIVARMERFSATEPVRQSSA